MTHKAGPLTVAVAISGLVLGGTGPAVAQKSPDAASHGDRSKMRAVSATLEGKPIPKRSVRGSTAGFPLQSPTWTKLLTTSKSHPFGGDEWNARPVGLAQHGYVEEEYIVSGAARVYDTVAKSDFAVSSKRASDYTTRALVRRPANVRSWSGDVVVEYMNATDGFGGLINWPRLAPDVLASNDVYVAFVGKPNAIPILQQFDPDRYGPLAMPNPLPAEAQTCGRLPSADRYNPNLSKLYENGLLWDIFSGIGLSFDSGASPLGRPAKRVFAVGESQSAFQLYNYYKWFGGNRTTYKGKPVFDGYLAETGRPLNTQLNQCAANLPPSDPQSDLTKMPRRGVPFFAVNSQWDVPATPPAPSSQYRLWSVAGADHVDKNLMDNMWPVKPDLIKARAAGPDAFPWQIEYGATLEAFSPAGWFCDDTRGPEVGLPEVEARAFRLLKKWVKSGIEPPIAPYFERDASGDLLLDADGNALGGLRLPYIEAPIARYLGGFWGDCADVHVPFTQERLQQLYGTHVGYVEAVRAAVAVAVRRGYISSHDGSEMVLNAMDRPIP